MRADLGMRAEPFDILKQEDQHATEECDQEDHVGALSEAEGVVVVRAHEERGNQQSAEQQHVQELQSMR